MKEIGRIIKLHGREYLIVSKIVYEGVNYLYLMSVKKPVEAIIASSSKLRHNVVELDVIADKQKRDELYKIFISSFN